MGGPGWQFPGSSRSARLHSEPRPAWATECNSKEFKKKKKKASIWEMEAEELEFKVSLSYTSKFLTGPDFMTRSLKKNKNKTQPLNDVVEEEVGR